VRTRMPVVVETMRHVLSRLNVMDRTIGRSFSERTLHEELLLFSALALDVFSLFSWCNGVVGFVISFDWPSLFEEGNKSVNLGLISLLFALSLPLPPPSRSSTSVALLRHE